MLSASGSDWTRNHAQIARTLPEEVRQTSRLGTPLALGQLGWMSTYIVDALMIGRLPHSALPISASSLGNTIFYAIAFCGVNLLVGLDTLVAQAYGRNDRESCTRCLAQTLLLAALATPIIMVLTIASVSLLPHFGTPPEIVAETSRYLHALVWSTAPLLLFIALRFYLQAIDRVLLITAALLSSCLVNWAGDWALLYGHLGFRPMGIAGSGWATCVVRLCMAAMLLVGVLRCQRKEGSPLTLAMFRPDRKLLRPLLKLGWPYSLQNLTDLGYSTYMSILCARLGTVLLAAHQVVLDLDAFVYMVPYGLSYATITRVGQSAGRGNLAQIKRSANASLLLGMGYIVIAALLFAKFRFFWAGLYTNDSAVVAAAAPLFVICGVLQLADAAAVLLASALTALGDTRTPFLANTGWYWLVGAPISWWLTFHSGLGLRGLWLGRAFASLVTAATLILAWRWRLRRMQGEPASISLNLLTPLIAK